MLTTDYRIAGVLGQGGFGLTYKADDLRLGTPVAIKECFPSELALREHGSTVVPRSKREEGVLAWGRAKFLEEARTLARFRHPNIVRVARLFEANNTAYMVLDFEMGPSLAEWRHRLGQTPTQAEVDRIAVKLLEAVEAVHDAGILHRDIKPANIIMRDETEPVLIDFGAARQAISAQSRTVHAIVTPGYSPMEQYAVDLDRQGAWSDIYALGATFYFLVTGKSPPDALSRDLGDRSPMAGADHGVGWRSGFLAAVVQAMSVRPEDRPQSIAEWREALFSVAPLAEPRIGAPSVDARPEKSGEAGAGPALAQRAMTAVGQGAARAVSFEEMPGPGGDAGLPRRRGWSAMLGGLVALSLASGAAYWVGVVVPARDEAAWQRAAATNTVEAYDRYVSEEPGGRHVAEARQRRDGLGTTAAQGAVSLASAQPPVAAPAPLPVESPSRPATPEPAPPAPPPAVPLEARPVAGTEPAAGIGPALARRTLPPPLSEPDIARLAATVAQKRWQLSSGLFLGQTAAGFSELDGLFAAELQRVSAGRLGVDVVAPPSNTSSEVRQELQRERGLLVWSSPVFEAQRRSEFAILAGSVPFGLEPVDHVRWLRAEGAALLERAYADLGAPVRAIPCGIAGGVGAWFRREIRSPADFRGLKVRGPLLTTRALRRLEAEVVTFGLAREIGPAFAQGRLDANFGYSNLTGVFLGQPQTVAGFYHYPGMHSPAYLFDLLIGVQAWAEMPEAQRQLIDEACRRTVDQSAAQFAGVQARTIDEIRRQRITVRPFTGPVREALQKAAAEVLAEESERNPRFREMLESYNRFRR